MNMLANAKAEIERSMTTRGKGYKSLANPADSDTSDRFYDEQLQSDGWHLDEVEDDDELDFSLPPSRHRPKPTSQCFCCPWFLAR
mmetsp:Transcript_12557/g.25243  ORF Transcript_12557/g.25243 Transcript_12557/m.25243 type:complete len:85 (-) Transcript_12557:508-762(-)|eukprot:CAMPEP_0174726228 /NCGR_PEP_ID=MMETSP1094-20130205/47273_1 /TAXON_ID=156173 /ORGANISM="Chrysochromulina brevifilum, Strain UTEX LB 985" /LENGTH=84 /DNA_ID=CAMNT_0015927753 /DNA_START=140 /DNA_END=394 /DNA_ORIENTATION=-